MNAPLRDTKSAPKPKNINGIKLTDAHEFIAYVDGSFNNKKNIAGYGLVLVQNDKVLFKDLGAFRHGGHLESRNVLGELRGALKAVELAIAKRAVELA